MNFALLKHTVRKNYKLFFTFFMVLCVYSATIASMFNPDDVEALEVMLSSLPETMLSAFGFSAVVTDLTSMMASWLYGLLMIGFPMVYSIILSNRLVAKSVDSGSMACLLATNLTRVQIVVTKGLYALVSVALLQMLAGGAGVLTCEILFPGTLQISAFLRLNITTALVNMLVMALAFFFSCLFNDSKYASGFATAIPVGFLLMKMLGDAGEQLKVLKSLSIYGWYDPVSLVNGTRYTQVNILYGVLCALLFYLAIFVFKNKKMPL